MQQWLAYQIELKQSWELKKHTHTSMAFTVYVSVTRIERFWILCQQLKLQNNCWRKNIHIPFSLRSFLMWVELSIFEESGKTGDWWLVGVLGDRNLELLSKGLLAIFGSTFECVRVIFLHGTRSVPGELDDWLPPELLDDCDGLLWTLLVRKRFCN